MSLVAMGRFYCDHNGCRAFIDVPVYVSIDHGDDGDGENIGIDADFPSDGWSGTQRASFCPLHPKRKAKR